MAKLSIVMPTYNEIGTLERVVDAIYAGTADTEVELVVVDDNSPDGTGKLAEELARKHVTMKVLHREGKLGRGTGFVDGLKAVTGDYVAVMDADMQHPPEVLNALLERAKSGADIVVASRYVGGGGAEGRSSSREAVSKTAVWLSHFFVPQTRHVKDTQSGYFVFRRDVLAGAELNVKGFTVLVEVLAKGKYGSVAEVPYTFSSREAGASKMGLGEIVSYARQLLRLSDYRILKFMTVGATGIAVNDGVLWLLVTFAGLLPLIAAVFSIEASILSNFVLNNYWTFQHRKGEGFHLKAAKYHGSVALGAVVNYVTFAALLALGFHFLAANTVGILLGFSLNYFLSETFVWKQP